MTVSTKNRIHDLMEQINRVDSMILLHSNNPSKRMSEQYEEMKKQFLGELIEELINIKHLSKYSFKLIDLAIKKYYPELIINESELNGIKSKKSSLEFKELEAALAG